MAFEARSDPPIAPLIPVGFSAKPRPPRLHEDALWRDELIRQLRATRARVVAVRAGAGYGKSTTVRQWVGVDERDTAWITLERSDRDPVVFLRHIVAAVSEAWGLVELEFALDHSRPISLPMVMASLADAIHGLPEPMVLVLDDVHEVGDEGSPAVLHWLSGLIPDGSALVLCGRSTPLDHVARRKMSGELFELTRQDLAFTPDESAAQIRRALPELDPGTVSTLVDLCEGWPGAMHLYLLALRSTDDLPRALAELPVRIRRFDGYFRTELLGNLPPDRRDFFLRTSVLERLSGPLCDAVVGGTGSGLLLEELADSENLFVVGFEDEPAWFRYHHLFADLLLSELRAAMPEEEVSLRRRASLWLSEHGQLDAAVRQAAATGDLSFAAQVVYRHTADAINGGQIQSLVDWVGFFTPEQQRAEPLLGLSAGWLAFSRGDVEELGQWLDLLASAEFTDPLPAGVPTFEVARNALFMLSGRGGSAVMCRHADVVVAAGPGANPWWAIASLLASATRFFMDPDADGKALLAQAVHATEGNPAAHSVALSQLSAILFGVGSEEEAQDLAGRAVDLVRTARLDDYPLIVEVPAVQALAAARRGDMTESAVASRRAVELVDAGLETFRGGFVALANLAEAARLRGEVSVAADFLDLLDGLLVEEPDAVVLREWSARVRTDLGVQRRREERVVDLGLTPAELRVLELLPTHFTLEEIGAELFVSRHTVKSHAVSIYRKLGVSGRSAAVERVQFLGLLPT